MYLIEYTSPYGSPAISTYYLRATILTGDRARATVYPTVDAAQQAIAKAKPFHKATVIKAMRVVYNAPASVETLTTV
jgi:hypothetical protein